MFSGVLRICCYFVECCWWFSVIFKVLLWHVCYVFILVVDFLLVVQFGYDCSVCFFAVDVLLFIQLCFELSVIFVDVCCWFSAIFPVLLISFMLFDLRCWFAVTCQFCCELYVFLSDLCWHSVMFSVLLWMCCYVLMFVVDAMLFFQFCCCDCHFIFRLWLLNFCYFASVVMLPFFILLRYVMLFRFVVIVLNIFNICCWISASCSVLFVNFLLLFWLLTLILC